MAIRKISMNSLRKFDAYTWSKLPQVVQSSLERRSWWKVLVIYSALLGLVIYRFGIIRKSIFFHSAPVTRSDDFSSRNQIKELIIHLIFFFLPMILAIGFSHARQVDGRAVNQ